MPRPNVPAIPAKFNAPACENRASTRESHATVSAARETVVAKSAPSEIGETPSRAFSPRAAVKSSGDGQTRKTPGAWRIGYKNRLRIIEEVRQHWAAGRSPIPKVLSFDIGLNASQVTRHLALLERDGVVVRRRVGQQIYVDQPA